MDEATPNNVLPLDKALDIGAGNGTPARGGYCVANKFAGTIAKILFLPGDLKISAADQKCED